MQVRPDAVDAALARALPVAAWIHGDEPLLQIEAGDAIRRAWRAAGFEERSIFQADRGFKVDMLAGEADALSLFASSKVIELRLSAKPGKELGEGVAGVIERLDDGVRLMVSSPRLDRSTTESAWFQRIDRRAMVVPVYPVEAAQLGAWIAGRLGRQDQRADRETLDFLAARFEGNLLAAHQEIRKLGLLFPTGALPGEAVRAAVLNVARYDAFDLANAMLAGDVARTLRSVEGLRAEGEAPPLVLWALSDALRTLTRAREAVNAGRAASQVLRELRVYPPRDKVYERALSRLSADRLRSGLQAAARIDRMVKGVAAGDPWSAIESLALTIAGAPMLRAPEHTES